MKHAPNSEIDAILYKIGQEINKVYTSDALTPWCTTHYFKLIKGRCVGCEAAKAIKDEILKARPAPKTATEEDYGEREDLYMKHIGYNQALKDWSKALGIGE